jgi:vancomycin resistance protein YoaR
MITQPVSPRPVDFTAPPLLARIAAAFAGAVGITLLAGLVFSIIFSLMYLGRILPGVTVGGVDLSGVRRTEAVQILQQQITYPTSGQVTLFYGDRTWTLTPAQLGLQLDAEASAKAAYAFGRSFWPWEALAQKVQSMRGGADLAPRLVFDGQIAHWALQGIATELNQPTIEAELSVNGLQVQVRPGQKGLTVNSELTSAYLAAQLLAMQNAEVPLLVDEQNPRILDVSAQATIAQNILSQPLTITPGGNYEDNPEPWVLQPDVLAGMLSIERVVSESEARYQVGLDPQELGAFIAGLASQVAEEPKNARFIFNDETRQLEVTVAGVVGRKLSVQASIEHINAQLAVGAHQIDLQYEFSEPELTDNVTAAELGITELVSEQTTYFYGSSDSRIQNIQTAAARFHGLLVPPGAVFSMVDNIGDISLESGFAEALIIFGDRTIKGVGGGVCQVSTTLFRTVFFGGFPIVERYAHAYRVGYYEMNAAGSTNTNLVGLDATVYAPIVDFKFQNDTEYWLLMETYVDPGARTITWKFYSTSDGRTVEWDTTGVQNVESPPDDIYEENAELSKGEVKQVDWAAQGADVTVFRSVYRDGQLINEDTITTHYEPWANVFQYGPGTQGYPPKNPQGQNDND